eukprot:CAMPEP_0201719002 /NCGR_PEP_ID=MMETSP0593-20130828/4355_1 /ASSEMBLY_ACC=CAM_ASM_000672 /TAXON_ID=267983 /ORGANISM="Skeletonema japonicum, Strain CCMP2506" /LENGTH=831 /DNA_ID=CAMNT_0048209391 /DNA_START=133 /DNA_END=2628 /DNA_ORIENTATION=+
MTKPSLEKSTSSRHRSPSNLSMTTMKIVVLLYCCLVHQHGGSRTFVAGFTTSKQTTVLSAYQSSPLMTSTSATKGRIHKTHLWYIEGENDNAEEDDTDDDDKFLPPSGDSGGGRKKKMRKVDVTVDVDVNIARGDGETSFEMKQEASQEFGQEEDYAESLDVEMVSSPLIFEDFVDDTLVDDTDTIAEYQEEEETEVAQEYTETSTAPPLLKAIEPTKNKPRKKFISPIQMIKKVPRVEPINMTSVFFVPTSFPGSIAGAADTFSNKKSSSDKPITWKDRMLSQQRRSTAFQATNYLQSLGNSADSSSSTDETEAGTQNSQQDDSENNNDAMYDDLKAQQNNLRNEQQKSMQEAIYAAMRRTSPKDVVQARLEKSEQKRKKTERDRLQREYVERKERLDAKKWEDDEAAKKGTTDAPASVGKNSRRGLPILGPFIKSPSPLLIGSTITFQYSEMTPFQKKALEVSQHYHEEHCTRMKEAAGQAGDEGGIQAAPIVAIIDSFTGEHTEMTPEDEQNKKKRFATLSAVEMEPSQDGSEPAVVKLTGVGRVFLYDYFSSKDAGITEEEVELENILKLIQEYDKEFEDMEDDEEEDGENDDDIPVVMASFDVILDDSSIIVNQSTKHQDATVHRASSMHAIAELYRTANRVYRLHEDRKKIVAGLKAAEERLLLGKERMHENCDIEYEDCDGLGMLSDGVDFSPNKIESVEITTGTARLSPLAKMENYGFGSFGILSTIPDLTNELMLYLESYYSPTHREREEYDAEIASFIAFRCLEEYVDPSDIAAAMLTRSATERLNLAYDLMMRHREELNELVKMISDDLYECGDDCKDLW